MAFEVPRDAIMFVTSISSVGLDKVYINCMKKTMKLFLEYLIEDGMLPAMLIKIITKSMDHFLSFFYSLIIIKNSGWSYVRRFF